MYGETPGEEAQPDGISYEDEGDEKQQSDEYAQHQGYPREIAGQILHQRLPAFHLFDFGEGLQYGDDARQAVRVHIVGPEPHVDGYGDGRCLEDGEEILPQHLLEFLFALGLAYHFRAADEGKGIDAGCAGGRLGLGDRGGAEQGNLYVLLEIVAHPAGVEYQGGGDSYQQQYKADADDG